MTADEMRNRVNQLRDDIANGERDPEKWHVEEDRIYTDALRSIADGYAEDPQALAAAALGAARLDFERWAA